mgnify:CR=1 FL=1
MDGYIGGNNFAVILCRFLISVGHMLLLMGTDGGSKSSAELKGMAKEQLFGSYGVAIGASLLVGFIMICILFLLQIFNSITTGGVISTPQLIITP